MSNMPKLPIETLCTGLTDDEARLVRAAFNGKTGLLRASKPYKSADCIEGKDNAEFKGAANYVWRWLCFDYVAFTPHCCMPVTDDFDLYYSVRGRADRANWVKGRVAELKELIKRAESNLPITAQAGAMRWARAYGLTN